MILSGTLATTSWSKGNGFPSSPAGSLSYPSQLAKNHFDCWDRRTVSTKTNTVSLGPGKHHQEGACWKRHMTAIYIYKSWSNNVLSCHICKLISWFDVLGVIENKTSNLSLWHLQSRDFRNETLWHHYETLSADHIDPTHLPAVPGRTSSDWIPRR